MNFKLSADSEMIISRYWWRNKLLYSLCRKRHNSISEVEVDASEDELKSLKETATILKNNSTDYREQLVSEELLTQLKEIGF